MQNDPSQPSPQVPNTSNAPGMQAFNQPAAAQPQPQPGTQSAWQPQVGVPVPPQAQNTSSFATSSKNRSLRLILPIAGAAVLICALAVFALTRFVLQPYSRADISTASQTASNIEQDLFDSTDAYNSMTEGMSVSSTTIASSVSTVNSKLADEQKQLDILQKSPVLKDATVDQKFKATQAKLTPYVAYLKASTSDYSVVGPIANNFETQVRNLDATDPTALADVPAYLSSARSAEDKANQQIASVNPQSDINKQRVSAVKTFVQSVTSVMAKVQSDYAAGKDIFTIQDDLFSLTTARETYTTATENLYQQESNTQKQLRPDTESGDLLTAITNLYAKAKR